MFENPTVFAAIAAFLSAFAAFLLFSNQRKKMIQEKRPILIFDEESVGKGNKSIIIYLINSGNEAVDNIVIPENAKISMMQEDKLGVCLYNVGQGAAFNLSIPEDIKEVNKEIFAEFDKIVRALLPGVKTKTMFKTGPNRHIQDETYWIVDYEDIDGRKYRTTLEGTKHRFKRIKWN